MLLKKITFQSIGYYGTYFVFDRCPSQLTHTSINFLSSLIKGDQSSTPRLGNSKKKNCFIVVQVQPHKPTELTLWASMGSLISSISGSCRPYLWNGLHLGITLKMRPFTLRSPLCKREKLFFMECAVKKCLRRRISSVSKCFERFEF